jgi:hypothetical protein
VGLSYLGEDIEHGYPGRLALETEENRQAILNARGPQAVREIWTPDMWRGGEMDYCEPAAADELRGLSLSLLNIITGWDSSREAAVNKLLRGILHRAAMRLNAIDWSGVLSVTDDFVVMAIDNSEGPNPKDLKASVPPERFQLLKDRKIALK